MTQHFQLTIKLGNEAMQGPDDIAHALMLIGENIGIKRATQGSILDANGNTVGDYQVLDTADADARISDPISSHERTAGRVDRDELMGHVWQMWTERPDGTAIGGSFTDDNVAEWTGKPRNVAAKIRQALEDDGLVTRWRYMNADNEPVHARKPNPRGQSVLCFRPVVTS